MHFFRQVQQLQIPAGFLHRRKPSDEFPYPRAVDVVHVPEGQHNLVPSLGQQIFDCIRQQRGAPPQNNFLMVARRAPLPPPGTPPPPISTTVTAPASRYVARITTRATAPAP